MGLSLSLLLSAWKQLLKHEFFWFKGPVEAVLEARSLSFKMKDGGVTSRSNSFKKERSETDRNFDHKTKMQRSLSFKNWEDAVDSEIESIYPSDDPVIDQKRSTLNSLNGRNCERIQITKPTISLPEPVIFFSPRPVTELDAAATKLQKVYKSYRTRRNLADCAVVVEELWWRTLDAATLKLSSVSFFDMEKHETAVSKWARAKKRAAKVGKGLSKDEKAQKLALQHWLEAIDPRHRYGHNLHFYYDAWSESKSTQPFFYWLDIGDGKDVNLEKCPRTKMQRQCIKYLGPKERESFEVIVECGRLVYRQSGLLVNTTEDSKWIFVLSTSRALYVGQKVKGVFQHSSFLSGGATTAAGRLVAHDGILQAIWPYSGHYLPTDDNFREFTSFLEEHNMDLANVKRCSIDEDYSSFKSAADDEIKPEEPNGSSETTASTNNTDAENNEAPIETDSKQDKPNAAPDSGALVFNLPKRLSCRWTSGVGPRIGCVRDYPMDLQSQALEHVNLSPGVAPGSCRLLPSCPIPSPRPSPKIRVSPRLAYMGIPSPRVPVNTGC